MEKLHKYQRAFYKAIFTNNFKGLENFIGQINDLEERVAIYSNNIFSSLKNVLKEDFPYCRKVLGEQKMNQANFEFVRNFPPSSGCLLDYGKKFPFFLETFFPSLPYIKDIAHLEWAKKELYYKGNSHPLDPKIIKGLSPDIYPNLIFKFPTATFFFNSSFSLEEIWNKDLKIRKPRSVPSYCLTIRPQFKVHHYWLSSEEFSFLAALHKGQTLGEAYDMAATLNPEFDLSAALGTALTRNYFIKVAISHENRTYL